MNIYLGNLSFDTTEDEINSLFAEYGEVSSVSIITDRYTGRSKGFGFVEMPDKEAAENAIRELNESNVGDRKIIVNEARPRTDRPQRRSRF